ncbi:MAG: sodium:solute symporter [Bacteroidales bacterium]|nr:sodium:solute symporter [Bacteroidales bacterium]
MNTLQILALVGAYFLLVFFVSWLASRRGASSAEFFRGDRKSPWYVVSISMIGTSISGVTFISVPGMVQASAFSYLQMVLGFVLGYAAVAYVLLPLYYRLNLKSIYGWLERRFGMAGYRTGAGFFLLSKVLGCGVRMYLTAIVLQLVLFGPLGIPFWVNVAATMLVVWLYTRRGGVKTLVWTDLLQTLSMLAAVVLCIVFVARTLGLDAGGLLRFVSESPDSRIWYFDDVKDTRYFWKQFLAGVFTVVAMTGLDQDMMQKNLSCRNLREAQKNMVTYGTMFVPVNLLFLALGVLLYAYAGMRGIAVVKPDDLFPTVACFAGLPPAVTLFFVLGLVSAAFSSAGSALTALTTTFTVDILRSDRRMDEAGLQRVRKRVHLGNAVLMAGVICLFRTIGNGSVIDAVYTVASYTYGPLLGLYCFGLVSRRAVRDRWVPAVCVLAPVLCAVLSAHSEAWFGGYRFGFELLLVDALLTMLGLLAISRRTDAAIARK